MEFWNDEVTDKSWEKLIALKKEIDFVLIGGWAVYLYTKLHKSKDIDIIVDYPVLRQMQSSYVLSKNDRLKKYEAKLPEGFDIDIYTPGYSELAVPVKAVMESTSMREGFMVPKPEFLLMLKLGAFKERKDSIKGGKDSIDMLGLIFNTGIDFNLLADLAKKYKHEDYPDLLLYALDNFDQSMIRYLDLNDNSFSKLKKRYRSLILDIL